MFNTDGDFLYKLGNEGEGDGEFNEPQWLSVDKAGHLMVCDSENHRVQVLEVNGKFITKFGRYRSEIGELSGPTSTAVLTDGRVVVTEFDNNRIQIIE